MQPKERDMQRLIMTAATAAVFCGAVMTATSAKAEYNYGSTKNGTQCYRMSTNGWNNQGFGFWSSCPTPAAAPNVNPRHAIHNPETHHQAKGKLGAG
jgi:hypothetical protein